MLERRTLTLQDVPGEKLEVEDVTGICHGSQPGPCIVPSVSTKLAQRARAARQAPPIPRGTLATAHASSSLPTCATDQRVRWRGRSEQHFYALWNNRAPSITVRNSIFYVGIVTQGNAPSLS